MNYTSDLDRILDSIKEDDFRPNWPEKSFEVYRTEAKLQLGNLWSLSKDGTQALCGNLQLRYVPERLIWVLFDDGKDIGHFVLPFSEKSLYRFQRTCSVHYREE